MAPLPTQSAARSGLVTATVVALLQLLQGEAPAKPAAAPSGVPALYPSQAEAEAAAKQHFHCTGAHRMGDRWMPCASHGATASPSGSHH